MTGLIEQIARAIIISSAGERAADHAQEFDTGNWANAKRAAQATAALAAENERLREALKPFAAKADARRHNQNGAVCFPQSFLIAARAALDGK